MPREKRLHGDLNVTLHIISKLKTTFYSEATYISDPSSSTGTTKAPAKHKAGS